MAFIALESVQFVYFGHIFQRVSSFLFGFLVFALTVGGFVGWAAIVRPGELRLAFSDFRLLVAINITAAMSWVGFLLAVQLIEPAVAYTIGAGAMPLSAYLAYRLGVPEGENMRCPVEALGNLLIAVGLVFLAAVTVSGWSGFVRGSSLAGTIGVLLAFAEGALFTWLLILCQRLNRAGVGAAVVFGLRFPLYVVLAGGLATIGAGQKESLPALELATVVAIGTALIVPPLYALQRAVALVSTLSIGALTALGPFIIFALQILEGHVALSLPTLIGLCIYFVGVIVAAFGAVRATTTVKSP